MVKFGFKNETKYRSGEVAKIVRWVMRYLEVEDRPVMVKIKHTNKNHPFAGRFYPEANRTAFAKVPHGTLYLIIARIAPPTAEKYPAVYHPYTRRNGPDPWTCETWREALVSIMAHEAMHLRQHVTNNGEHGKYNEVDTEWAAYRLLQEWKKEMA